MSILQKVVGIVVKQLPPKPADDLIGREAEVGKPRSRVDGPLKVAGEARYTAEIKLPHFAYAALVLSTIAKGRIVSIDSTKARGMKGVVAIMTHENAPRMKAPPRMMDDRNSASTSDLPVMQDDSVHWNGEPLAVVIAESQEVADEAAHLIRIQYAAEKAGLSLNLLRARAHPPKNILGEPAKLVKGEAEEALRNAPTSIDRLYRTPRYHHSAIELHVTTAHWESPDRLTVYDSNQMLNGTQYTLAKVFGLKEANIRVVAEFVGGAFGGKGVWSHTLLCIAAAKLAGRPVRLVLSREGVFRATGGRTLSEQRVALGANHDGTLAALVHTGVTAVTSHNSCPEQFSFPARHLYAADSYLIAQEVVELDMVANTTMRAPGESIGTFALESAIDELALKLDLDPVELRRRIEPSRDPVSESSFSSRNLLAAYEKGAERFGWSDRNRIPGSKCEGEWLIGQGVATATYPYYRMPGGMARIRLFADGSARVQTAVHEMGMGTATVQAQHAADRLGLPVERIQFDYGDTDLPAGTMAGGSSQTVSVIATVIAAAEKLIELLIQLAGKDSPLDGAEPAHLVARDAGLWHRDDATRGETYAAILKRVGKDHIEAESAAPMPIEMMQFSMHSYGAQFCEVRVNAVTGEIRVLRWLGSFDTGRILNAKTAASQFHGGIVMGIGLALTEESQFDERTGRTMNPSLAEYHVPVHLDVPVIDVIWTNIPDPHAPMGAHGIGEIGITGVGAAIANAVFNATGIRVRDLPITVDKILAGQKQEQSKLAVSR